MSNAVNVKQEVKSEFAPLEPLRRDDTETELDFAKANEKIWLVKLPKFLFDRWATAEPGTELGHLKMNEANRKEMKVVLLDRSKQDQKLENLDALQPEIPLEYSLEMQNQNVINTFVFSEPAAKTWADRPSRANSPVKAAVNEGESPDASGAPDDDTPQRRPGGGPDRSRKNLGGQRLGGKVVHDCLVKPIDNLLYRNLLRDRVTAADVPKRRVQSINDVALSGDLMAPGSVKVKPGGVKSFIVSHKAAAKKNREINARMSLDNLLDEIVNCFKQYEYWSLKAFKAHLKQPESYLKETLENIATLHKRGPMTGKWQLKAETRNAMKGFAGLAQFDKSTVGDASGEPDDQKIKSEHEGEAAPDADLEDSDEDIEMEDRL